MCLLFQAVDVLEHVDRLTSTCWPDQEAREIVTNAQVEQASVSYGVHSLDKYVSHLQQALFRYIASSNPLNSESIWFPSPSMLNIFKLHKAIYLPHVHTQKIRFLDDLYLE